MSLIQVKREDRRFCTIANNIRHICGMLLSMKRYIGRSPVMEWAAFHLKLQTRAKTDLLFNINSFSKNQQKKDSEKLKSLLRICPKQRSLEALRKIQLCLKKNRTFQCLPDKIQLQLCQTLVFQQYEAKSLLIKQGHIPSECYLILSGNLKIILGDLNSKIRNFTSETLYEVEEGDFIGEICLVTNKRRPASVVCTSEVELLVIYKEDFDCILADFIQKQYNARCDFLQKLPIFSSWPLEKLGDLVHCSLQRNYRAGTAIVLEGHNSPFLVFVKSGRCLIVTQLSKGTTCLNALKSYPSLLKHFPTLSLFQEKMDFIGDMCGRSVECSRMAHSAAVTSTLDHIPRRPRPQTAAPQCHSYRDRRNFNNVHWKDGNEDEMRRHGRQQKVISKFITTGVLEQGGIFGMAEVMSKLQFSLISEGAECIFIPRKLFLEEASAKSRHVAQELVSTYPTEKMIRENYMQQHAWSTYKARLIGQQLGRNTRPSSAHSFFKS
ncbi:cyclic nucleotide-binding domain-containing protein 2-like [Rhinatrema bivittatum]|uniref:cyclic nucleotide-binding domain-containing protein 2-like n=1 Tax=Rhinatrema bivittatum TaxID=194408 RepID=UPI00112A6D97|nr:cyclic nucleotide-binding domain-containing protein 2-like [Rhinatrema bivittatum]